MDSLIDNPPQSFFNVAKLCAGLEEWCKKAAKAEGKETPGDLMHNVGNDSSFMVDCIDQRPFA